MRFLLLLLVFSLGAARGSAQTVDEIVAKNLDAKGGVERLKAITGLKLIGKGRSGGVEYPITVYMKRPDLVRQEMMVNGQRIIQAYDGQRAWFVNPLVGVTTPQEIERPPSGGAPSAPDFDGPLLNYKEKGVTIELQGMDTVDGKPAQKLKLDRKGLPSVTLYLDAETGLDVRSVTEIEQPERVRIENRVLNYRQVQGLMLPFEVRTLVNGQEQSRLTIESVEISPLLDEKLFRNP